MSIATLTAVARILKAEGVEWVSTFPVCHVNNALAAEGLQLVMMRDERYAVAVADAFGRVTAGQRPGVCTVMGGTNPAGVQMAYGALAQAYEDSSPLLCLAEGMAPGDPATPRYELERSLATVTKWVGQISAPEQTPQVLRRAFHLLRNGRPGPVAVTILRGLGEYDEAQHPYAPAPRVRSAPDPADVRAAVTALRGARAPLLYAGEGVLYAGAVDALRALAEAAALPVLTTLKGKSAFAEHHPLSLGVRGEAAIAYLRRCDVLLAVGTSLSRGHFRHTIPAAARKVIIHATNDPGDLNRTYAASQALLGDARLTLEALAAELARQGGPGAWQAASGQVAGDREAALAPYSALFDAAETPINPYRVYGELMRLLDPQASFVSGDSGSTRDQLSTVYRAGAPRSFLGWGNVSTLGFSLAAAVGARLAHPTWPCVAVAGDAGVGYMAGNLEPLVRCRLGVTIVHINNGGFAGYGPGFWGPGHDPYTCAVLDHTVAHWADAAASLGLHAERVLAPDHIAPALQRALAANAEGQPAFLEIICSQYPVFGAWATAE